MLFYIRCPSCGTVIAENIKEFYAECNVILSNPNLTPKQKEIAKSKLIKHTNICCRSRLLGLIPYHEIVI